MGLKIGIVGAGGMANYHVPGFREGGADVVAIADPNQESAKRAAEELEIEKVYASSAEMYEKETDLDAASIITPNKFHKDLAIEGLNAGKHMFCEKPPALNAGEVMQMKAASEANGKTLMFNMNNRTRPESYAMMEYIKQGVVGQINSAQAMWIRRTGIPGFGGWFTTKDLAGGGPLIDLLHMVDLALFFMGFPEPEYVLGQTFDDFIGDKTFKGPWGIPDVEDGVTDVEAACQAFVRFKTGQVLTLRNSWAEMNKREECSVTFQGQKAGGMIQRLWEIDGLDETSIDTCELYTHENGRAVNRQVIHEKDDTMGRLRSATNFALAIQGKEDPINNIDEALKLMKVIDAVYESAASGKPVAIQ